MVEASPATRPLLRALSPLDGRYASAPGVTLSPLVARRRVSLRADEAAVGAVEAALGLALPKRPKTVAEAGGLAALWLGPDEWLVLGEGDAAFDGLLSLSGALSAVEVTHRNVGIALSGPLAQATLSGACAQDLRPDRFPVGAASRTLFGKAEIVLWRRGETRFEIECWRSFSDYVWSLLAETMRGAVA